MTEADFLKTIIEQPDDEVARLAFADWLMERGDAASVARGDFIQVQIQLTHRIEGSGNPAEWVDVARVPELKAREKELLAAHGGEWAKPVAKLVDAFQFRKGFIEYVTLAGNHFLLHAEQLFDLAPIQRVRLHGTLTKKLADSPFLGRLTGLDFSRSYIGDAGLRTVLASPYLERLSWMDLSYCSLTNRGVASLAESPLLARLTHLNLGNNSLGLEAVQSLLGSPYCRKIQTLILTGNRAIDSRAQQFLSQTLQGAHDPALLRSMLQLTSREEREYSNVHVRDLAERAGRNPEAAPVILGEGLGDGRRKVRSAAAQMVAQLGGAGAAALPKLVQRLFEQNRLTRDHVAPALARLLPDLSPELQCWLCLLANPLLPPQGNLRAALESRRLPDAVREGFIGVCARRAAWWTQLGGEDVDPAPKPKPGNVGEAVANVLDRAEKHAGRHHTGAAQKKEGEAGRHKEAAWLLARLTELLQATLPPPEPAPEPVKKGRKRV